LASRNRRRTGETCVKEQLRVLLERRAAAGRMSLRV
jgi:hypothetical protein